MKLSVSTSGFIGLYNTPEENIEACSKTRFKYLDMSLGFVCNNPDIQESVDKILLYKEKYNIGFTMGHAPFNYNPFSSDEDFEKQTLEVKNAIKVASLIGVDRVTVHGGSSFAQDQLDLLNKNVEYFKNILETAEKYNVYVMIENISSKLRKRPFDVETADDILYIADKLNNHSLLKACWDSGHANTMGLEQYNNIVKLKDMLYGIHLHDNCGLNDDHMLPLFGTVNFDEVIQGLKDINYQGPFNFEAHVFNNGKTWPNFRNEFCENYNGAKVLFDPDEELKYFGLEIMYNIANYMAKKHELKID